MESFESEVRENNSYALPSRNERVSHLKLDIDRGRTQSRLHKDIQRFPIPEEDLIILERIYHKRYSDCGRKRGALLRYIKFFKETQEPPSLAKNFLRFIQIETTGANTS